MQPWAPLFQGTVLCDIILLNFLKGADQYKAKKFEEVRDPEWGPGPTSPFGGFMGAGYTCSVLWTRPGRTLSRGTGYPHNPAGHQQPAPPHLQVNGTTLKVAASANAVSPSDQATEEQQSTDSGAYSIGH